MTNDEYFAEKVQEQKVPIYRSTKSQFKDYFGSSRKAAEYGIEHGAFLNRQGEPVKLASAMRRFQSRGGKSQSENASVYAELGKTLPPTGYTKPTGGYSFHVVIVVAFSPGKCDNQREFDVTLTQDEPSIDDVIASYFEGDYENPVEEICSITVS